MSNNRSPNPNLPTLASDNLPLNKRLWATVSERLTAALNDSWQKFIDPDPVRWIQAHFYIPELNAPMILYPSQQAPLREALRMNDAGELLYSLVVWSDIKKSAKSSIAAAVGVWRAWQKPWSKISVIANDLKQADSRVAYYMRRAIELHPEMASLVKVVNYKIVFPNHSVIEALPIDPKGEAGGGDDMVIYSELWGWKNSAAQRMWTETTLSPLKFGHSQRWVETYAGIEGESPVLENLYDTGVRNGELIDPENQVYVNRGSRQFTLWRTHPHLPWQTDDYYRQESSLLTPSEFRRVHRNEFVSSEDAFIPSEWWDGAKSEIAPPSRNEPIILAADAATVSDCFGLVAVAGAGKDGDTVRYRVVYARAWRAPKTGEIQFRSLNGDGPEDEIRRLLSQYNVVELCYDPYQLKDLGQRFRSEGLCHLREFAQGKPRALADKALFDRIRARRVLHNGDATLREHITNANRREEDGGLRIVKRNDNQKIDLCVALSMAVDRAAHWRIGE